MLFFDLIYLLFEITIHWEMLVQMNLTYHAIKSRKYKLSALDYTEEFSLENVSEPDAFDLDRSSSSEVDVYDVILAGVLNG